jgi:hypothetical protein
LRNFRLQAHGEKAQSVSDATSDYHARQTICETADRPQRFRQKRGTKARSERCSALNGLERRLWEIFACQNSPFRCARAGPRQTHGSNIPAGAVESFRLPAYPRVIGDCRQR